MLVRVIPLVLLAVGCGEELAVEVGDGGAAEVCGDATDPGFEPDEPRPSRVFLGPRTSIVLDGGPLGGTVQATACAREQCLLVVRRHSAFSVGVLVERSTLRVIREPVELPHCPGPAVSDGRGFVVLCAGGPLRVSCDGRTTMLEAPVELDDLIVHNDRYLAVDTSGPTLFRIQGDEVVPTGCCDEYMPAAAEGRLMSSHAGPVYLRSHLTAAFLLSADGDRVVHRVSHLWGEEWAYGGSFDRGVSIGNTTHVLATESGESPCPCFLWTRIDWSAGTITRESCDTAEFRPFLFSDTYPVGDTHYVNDELVRITPDSEPIEDEPVDVTAEHLLVLDDARVAIVESSSMDRPDITLQIVEYVEGYEP